MIRLKLALIYCLAISLIFTSCKKDNLDNLPKLKSMTTNDGRSSTQRVEFEYDVNGNLTKGSLLVNGVLQGYLSYEYNDGLVRKAFSYTVKQQGESKLVAEINFSYNKKRLSEIMITPKDAGINGLTMKFTFAYGTGDIPLNQTTVLNGNNVVNPGSVPVKVDPNTGQFIFNDSQTGGQSTSVINPADRAEFDDKKNPMYHLPLLLNYPLPASQGSIYLYSFDFNSFFQKHNQTKMTSTIGPFTTVTYYTYTYNEHGQPTKSIRTNSSNQSKFETVYEY